MIDIQRLSYPADSSTYFTVWNWMQAQPQLYEHLHGFDVFERFVRPDFEVADFAFWYDGELIAFAALMYRGSKRCQFCLVTPATPKLRPLLEGLRCLQATYFIQLGFSELYVHLRPLPQYDRARRLAKYMGWKRLNDDLWVITLDHFIQQYISQENYVERKRRDCNSAF